MTNEWNGMVEWLTKAKQNNWKFVPTNEQQESILKMDLYVRKLERELQALKNKKAVAAILQKKV